MSETEVLLWGKVRKKQILGFQFYRQRPIGPYVVDFYCPKAKLVIEVDGSHHFEEIQEAKDQRREKFLKDKGLKVLRFNTLDIFQNMDGVLDTIFDFLDKEIE